MIKKHRWNTPHPPSLPGKIYKAINRQDIFLFFYIVNRNVSTKTILAFIKYSLHVGQISVIGHLSAISTLIFKFPFLSKNQSYIYGMGYFYIFFKKCTELQLTFSVPTKEATIMFAWVQLRQFLNSNYNFRTHFWD